MPSITLNGEMTLAYPEDFRKLDNSELNQMPMLNRAPGSTAICLKNSEKHLAVTLGFGKIPLIARILSEKDLIKKAEQDVSAALKARDYKLGGFSDRNIGGIPARCFRYTYTAEGIGMSSESSVIRDGGKTWWFHFYYRTGLEAESLPVWEQMLDSVKWE